MNSDGIIAALGLPADSRVDQRVPKKLLMEHGAPTSADKRRISDGVDEIQWVAVLKPATIGVPAFRDDTREYLEIAVLSVALRAGAKTSRLVELIHRAVPYPVFLVATHGECLNVSLAHKRWSQGQVGATVLDGDLVAADLPRGGQEGIIQPFLTSLALARQPHTDLFGLYQGWVDKAVALLAATITGVFAESDSRQRVNERQEALRECARLDSEIARLRAIAAKERQIPRQVELNLELKRLERQRSDAKGWLGP